MPIRPPSSVAIATRKPRFSSCSRRSAPTNAPSRRMSAVDELLRPSFSSSRVTSTSAPSTRNALTPFAPSVEGSVRAKTRNVPAWLPFVIHCLAPLSLQPSPSGTALVRSAPASDPEPGSVSANAPSTRPVASSGTNRRRCSSVPNERIGSVAALVCTATVTPTPASARDSSSSTRMYETKSAPAPPSSSGTQTPSRPSSPSFANSGLREGVVAVPRGRVRHDLGVGEFPRERLDRALLRRRGEVHRVASIVGRGAGPLARFSCSAVLSAGLTRDRRRRLSSRRPLYDGPRRRRAVRRMPSAEEAPQPARAGRRAEADAAGPHGRRGTRVELEGRAEREPPHRAARGPCSSMKNPAP